MTDPKHHTPEPDVPWYRRDLLALSTAPKIALVFAVMLVSILALRWGVAIGDTIGRGYSPTYCRVQ